MKVTFGILNWNRNVLKVLPNISPECPLVICTNQTYHENTFASNVVLIKADPCIPKSKNMIIEKAKELESDYLVLMEDDLIFTDISIISKFIDKMEEFNLGMMFYAYHSRNNVAFGKPIPCLEISYSKEEKETFSRLPCTALLVIDMKKNQELFREDLKTVYFDEYLQRCKDKKFIPFNGFFFDIEKSFEHIKRTDDPTLFVPTNADIENDRRLMQANKIELKIDNNFNEVKTFLFNHILAKEGLLKPEVKNV